MQSFIKNIDALSEVLGRSIAWLTLLLVLITFVIVLMRYLFNIGSVALQESLLYMHSLIFLMGASYTLRHDAHVRVDIFYRPMGPKGKAWVNLAGTFCLLVPFCLFIFAMSWEYVQSSWSYYEGSRESGGLDAVFLLKSLLLAMPLLVLLQGLAECARSVLVITDRLELEPNDTAPHS